jgi:drug/metabolite transporter (DMT)-like permease
MHAAPPGFLSLLGKNNTGGVHCLTLMKLPQIISSICLFLSLVFQTASSGFGKSASLSIERFTPWNVATNPYYVLCLACLGLQAFTWQIALRKYPLSVAYLIMSLIYVNILLMSVFIFHERVTPGNFGGAGLIVAGVILLTQGQTAKKNV